MALCSSNVPPTSITVGKGNAGIAGSAKGARKPKASKGLSKESKSPRMGSSKR